MNARNNTGGIGKVGRNEVYGGRDEDLLAVQAAMARKLVSELKDFDNVYFEVCNEPYERGGLTAAWNDRIIEEIVGAESALPARHLIAQGMAHGAAEVKNLNRHVSVLNFHAGRPDAVRLNYALSRVIADDETGGSDRSDRKYRTEAWEFLLSGGGVFDHLDFSFTTDRPDGSAAPLPAGTPGGGGPELRRQLQILKQFLEGFDFVKLTPQSTVLTRHNIDAAAGQEPATHVLAETGAAYAIYVAGGTKAELVLKLPPGDYLGQWINPRTGKVERDEPCRSAGSECTFNSPPYAEDIALRIRKTARQP
jgi:hypothetical protein